MNAAMSQVDLLEVVQVPVPEDVLVDAEEVVEAEVEDLGGGVQARDLGEGRVEALHRLLAALPLADAVLGTVAIRGGVLKTNVYYDDKINRSDRLSSCS